VIVDQWSDWSSMGLRRNPDSCAGLSEFVSSSSPLSSGNMIRSVRSRCSSSADQRQLFLPAVLPQLEILPDCLSRMLPASFLGSAVFGPLSSMLETRG
jgi:hypothetical protein